MRRVIRVTAGDELEIFLFLMMGRSLGSLGRLTTGNRPIKGEGEFQLTLSYCSPLLGMLSQTTFRSVISIISTARSQLPPCPTMSHSHRPEAQLITFDFHLCDCTGSAFIRVFRNLSSHERPQKIFLSLAFGPYIISRL